LALAFLAPAGAVKRKYATGNPANMRAVM